MIIVKLDLQDGRNPVEVAVSTYIEELRLLAFMKCAQLNQEFLSDCEESLGRKKTA